MVYNLTVIRFMPPSFCDEIIALAIVAFNTVFSETPRFFNTMSSATPLALDLQFISIDEDNSGEVRRKMSI